MIFVFVRFCAYRTVDKHTIQYNTIESKGNYPYMLVNGSLSMFIMYILTPLYPVQKATQ